LLLVVLIILSVNIISAEIMLSQPSSIYNLGENLDIEATIKATEHTTDFFEMNIVCKEKEKNFYKSPLTLDKGEEKKISSSLALTKSFLEDLIGDCNILAKFSSEEAKSQTFKVSSSINVKLDIGTISIDAGKEVILKGTATKENGKKVEGFVEIYVENTDIKITRSVSNGEFSVSIKFPENMKAGSYSLIAKTYEKSETEETNIGESRIMLEIRKKPTKIEIVIENQNIKPGETLIFAPVIYDQTDEQVEGEIGVKIYSPDNKVFYQKVLKSNELHELKTETNQKPGYWKIESFALDLNAERMFYVEELEKADFGVENDTLIITNIGNIVYKKPVQISIGDVVEVKNIELEVGETKKFKLVAPEGNYDVSISDGTEEGIFNEVPLTGKVTGVSEIGRLSGKYPIVWLFLVVVFSMFILVLIQRITRKKFYVAPAVSEKQEKKQEAEKLLPVPIPTKLEKAEHSLVLDGRKENTSIVAINIKNIKDKNLLSSQISKEIVNNKGVVYDTIDNIIGIFSSLTTKTFGNEIIAVKTARKINDLLKEYNQKAREKTIYGIAINSGELILKKDSGLLKFTTIGNAINLGKKLAGLAQNEVLISENIQKKLISDIKTEKITKEGVDAYYVKGIIERDKNKEFISDFLRRQQA